MAINVVSEPNVRSRLSDNLEFVFNLTSVGDLVNTKISFGYKIYKVVSGSEVQISKKNLQFDPRNTGNFAISIKREAFANLFTPIPNLGAGVTGTIPDAREEVGMWVDIKIKYWEVSTDLNTCAEVIVGSQLDTTVIRVFNSVQRWYDTRGAIAASEILTQRPCLIPSSSNCEDFLYALENCVVRVNGYDADRNQLVNTLEVTSGADVRSIGIGPKNILTYPGWSNVEFYIVQAWNGPVSGDPDFTFKYMIDYSDEAVPVIFQEYDGGYSSISFEYAENGNISFVESRARVDVDGHAGFSSVGRLEAGPRIVDKPGQNIISLVKKIPMDQDWKKWLEVFIKSKSYIAHMRGVEVSVGLVPGTYGTFVRKRELFFRASFEILTVDDAPNSIY